MTSPDATTARSRVPRLLLLLGRLVLGGVFVYAAYAKLRDPWILFAMSIDSYRMLPTWAVNTIARMLPWVEMLIGVLLLTGWLLRWVSAAATALLVVFVGAMIWAQVHGLSIDCGCFGVGERLGPATYIRDGLLILLAVAVTVGAFWVRRSPRIVAESALPNPVLPSP